MYIVFIVMGILFLLAGLFLVVFFLGQTQMLGFGVIGAALFIAAIARIEQARTQHKALMKAVRERESAA